MCETTQEMPKYRSHKEVWACKIKEIEDPAAKSGDESNGSRILSFEEGGYVRVDHEYVKKHDPKVGGYYVVYQGGYKSWSPAEAFESGYTKI